MVFRILVTHSTTLYHLEHIKRNLNRFYSSTFDGSRKDKRVLFKVVGIIEHTMVHCHSFLQMFLHAFQYVDLNCAVREIDTKEFTFQFSETLFILYCLFESRCPFFLFSLPTKFVLSAVVFGYEVGRTNILRAVYVLARSAEHIHIVAPYRNVPYVIAVASGNLIGLPTSVKCP